VVCVFPAMSTAVFATEAIHFTDEMFIAAAEAVAEEEQKRTSPWG